MLLYKVQLPAIAAPAVRTQATVVFSGQSASVAAMYDPIAVKIKPDNRANNFLLLGIAIPWGDRS